MKLTDAQIEYIVNSQKDGLCFLEEYDKKLVERPSVPFDVSFLDVESVIGLHESLGMGDGLRSLDLLESALSRARQASYYASPTLQEMGALIAEGIVRNHPFVDGNKRTALLALCAFLATNGEPVPTDSKKTGSMILGLATREITVEDVGKFLVLCEQEYLKLPRQEKEHTMIL